MSNIIIMSRPMAEKAIRDGFPKNTAVISFHDPKTHRTPADYVPLDYGNTCERIFPVALHDIDPEILEDYGLTMATYFPERHDVARFILAAIHNGMDIICQCEYGQSRSAGCAAAIKEFLDRTGIEVFADYRYYPNPLVFNKMLDALRQVYAQEYGREVQHLHHLPF